MDNKSLFFGIIVSLIAAILGWQILVRVDKYLLDKAITSCGQTASVIYETDQGKAKTTEPFKPAYEQCLKDKGVK